MRTHEQHGCLPAPDDASWYAMIDRHKAALDVIRGGTELDRELMLSYVVWPTEWMEAIARERARRPAQATPLRAA